MNQPGRLRYLPYRMTRPCGNFCACPGTFIKGTLTESPLLSLNSASFWIPGAGLSLNRRGPVFFGLPKRPAGGAPVGPHQSAPRHLSWPGNRLFGFFESVPDQDVAAALFEAAAAWLRERGKTRLVGPLNFGIYDEMGLLVEGFDSMPVLFQTHNPPYYQDLLASLGFVKAMDWHAYKITNRQADLEAMQRRYDEIIRGQDLEIVTYNPKEVDRRADEVFHLFNTAWAPNWGHVPLTRRQFDDMFAMVKPCLRPGMAYVLLDDGRVAGFGIALPDLNPLIRQLNGRLTLWGKLRLLYWAKYRPVTKIRAMVVGISQPYQRRYLHLALLLRAYIYLVKHTPCEMADLSLVPANLKHWIKVIVALGGQRYKVFRVFEKPI